MSRIILSNNIYREKELDMKLVHKFTFGLLLIVLVCSLTGFFAIRQGKKILYSAFIDNSEALVFEKLHSVERELSNLIQEFHAFEDNVQLQKSLIASNKEFDKLGNVQAYINKRDKEWSSADREKLPSFINDTLNNDLSKEINKRLDFYKLSHGDNVIGEFFVTNAYGANISQSGITSDYRQDDEEWWQISKRDNLHIGTVAYDESANMFAIPIGLSIEDEDYNFIGVMKIVFNIEYATRYMDRKELPGIHKHHKTMQFTMLTREGNVIYSSSNKYDIFETVTYLLPERHLSPEPDHHVLSSEILTKEVNGREIIIIHAHSKGNSILEKLGWVLVIEHDEDEIFAPVSELTDQIIIITMIVSMLSLLIGLFISRSLHKRIRSFQNIITKLGKGDMNVSLDTESKDELGELAISFKTMANSLKTTTVNRDELVEEIERRKLAEASTHDNEERFRSVAENASDAIIYISEIGEIIFWNNSAENIFGYSAEEVVGHSVTCIIPEKFQKAHTDGMLRVIKHGKSKLAGKSVQLNAIRKDGTEFPIELSISSWTIGKDAYFTGIIRDISERKHAEDVINEQVGRLSALRSIDRAIIGSLDLNVTLDVFLTQVQSQLHIDASSVLLLNKNTQSLEHVVSKGFRSNALKHTKLRLGESNAGKAALERSVVSIPNLKEHVNGFTNSKEFSNEDFVSYFAVPLIAKGQVKGVMELFNRSYMNSKNGWMEFLEAIADQGAIALDNATMFDDLQRSNIELSLAYDTTIEGWAQALDLRDKETEGHSRRVTELAVRIANEFKMSDEEIVQIRRGALLHDIGKMGIPDSILLKPGKLTDEERNIMMQHPVHARNLLFPIEYLRPALDIPYYHHERWDGTGYPDGLKGDKIPLSARIFALVDVWDALRSDRPYRPAWPIEKVKEHIQHQVGSHFDAGVIEIFLSMELH